MRASALRISSVAERAPVKSEVAKKPLDSRYRRWFDSRIRYLPRNSAVIYVLRF